MAAEALADSDVRVAGVIGYPSGAHRPEVKALEAERALADAAHELDMVVNLAAVRAREWSRVVAEIAGVRAAAPGAVLKVIVEAGALVPDELIDACRATDEAGADYVKTSTGFHPAGGPTVHDVRLMAQTVSARLGVKASGAIRSADAALGLVAAGATRLGRRLPALFWRRCPSRPPPEWLMSQDAATRERLSDAAEIVAARFRART